MIFFKGVKFSTQATVKLTVLSGTQEYFKFVMLFPAALTFNMLPWLVSSIFNSGSSDDERTDFGYFYLKDLKSFSSKARTPVKIILDLSLCCVGGTSLPQKAVLITCLCIHGKSA